MSKAKVDNLIPHNWANHLCECYGCSGARKARHGYATPQWYDKPYGKGRPKDRA